MMLPSLALFSPVAQAFDFDTGNAPIEVVIPAAAPRIVETVNPGDATLVLRYTTIITAGWFDAIAPYDDLADAIHTDLGRRPAAEQTDRNRNIAILYASHRVLDNLLPQYASDWDAMLSDVGLDPNDTNVVLDNPAGIGNAAAAAIIAAREHDGMNQLGDEDGCRYNCRPYSDYTGYKPYNTPEILWNAKYWQPDIVTSGNGIFEAQKFVTAHLENVTPFSYTSPTLQAPSPWRSYSVILGFYALPAYRDQADEVLAVSAALTDHQKMTAELFNDKIRSLGFSAVFVALSRGMTLQEFVEFDFLLNMAAFDAGITVWKEKRRYNAVRPFSAVRHLYGDDPLTAWGGPGMGTVTDILGSEWRPYLQTADHPEYPSGSAAFCAAHAAAATLYTGTSDFGWSIPTPAGSSLVEPGLTPSTDIVLGPWATWDDFAEECAQSRLWAGVHFSDALDAGAAIGEVIGTDAYDFLDMYIQGTAR
jgi:hypothetical protein